jgi:hypothetical protein
LCGSSFGWNSLPAKSRNCAMRLRRFCDRSARHRPDTLSDKSLASAGRQVLDQIKRGPHRASVSKEVVDSQPQRRPRLRQFSNVRSRQFFKRFLIPNRVAMHDGIPDRNEFDYPFRSPLLLLLKAALQQYRLSTWCWVARNFLIGEPATSSKSTRRSAMSMVNRKLMGSPGELSHRPQSPFS